MPGGNGGGVNGGGGVASAGGFANGNVNGGGPGAGEADGGYNGGGFGSGGPNDLGAEGYDPEFDEPDNGPLRERLVWAMERTGWVQAKAARLLGMTTRQVSYALRKYNIEIKRF
jgi:hypothetical protein